MLALHTIRRKMLLWTSVLALLLAGLAMASNSGLRSYKETVEDLELSISTAPRSSDLATAVIRLIKPCLLEVPQATGPQRDKAAQFQQREVRAALQEARNRVETFQAQLHNLTNLTDGGTVATLAYRALFSRLNEGLANMEGEAACLAKPGQSCEVHLQFILREASELMTTIDSAPDPALELSNRLSKAKREYSWRLTVVRTTTVLTVVLFVGLVFYARRWIFIPLRSIHQGALRVANGKDFTFRLQCHTEDELAELAEAFNQMTARFQEVTADLDQQVQQRSRQLVQSERLAGVGFLAAGVAHEINNPLSAIVGAADSLEWRLSEQLDKFPADDARVIREYLQMMQSEAQRCRKITEKLLNFARGTDSERNLYDITAIIQEVVGMTQHVGRFRDRQIVVERNTPCYAWINGPEIKQVVLNLIANALEATGDNGRVTIGIREYPEQVEIAITDNGQGMSPEVLQHIFEPFYTRKEAGKGTGLGLSISHRIVQDHGGTLEASSPGSNQGSTFRLRLPGSAAQQRAA
ncbi:MAG: sensor histidine kinase [Planctomycetaceae bacterium]